MWSWPPCARLAAQGTVEAARVSEAIERYQIDPDTPMPTTV